MLGTFCSAQSLSFYHFGTGQRMYISTVRKIVQTAVLHNNILPPATVPLVRAYEALLTLFPTSGNMTSPCIEAPFHYGRRLSLRSADDRTTHTSITLLLARQVSLHPIATRASQVQEVITMLWLRPSNTVLRNWDHLAEDEKPGVQINTKITLDWIKNADSIPHIVEILRHLSTAQKSDPTIGPLWRTTVPGEVNDPHFVDALQTFDRLMGADCSDADHCILINLVCQDLELEPYPDFDNYFTPSRLDSLSLLKDPRLKILVGCTRGPDFLSHAIVPEAYSQARRQSLTCVAVYVYKHFSSIDCAAVLQLQASLWPMNPKQEDLYREAMHDTIIFNFLRRMFKHPVPCLWCLDGPGHLAAHLLSEWVVEVSQKVALLGKIPLEGRYMSGARAILISLSNDDTSSWVSYLPQAEEIIRWTLEEDIKEVLASQFHFLVMIWNTAKELLFGRPEDVAPVVAGIHKALRLSYDSRSTLILAPLSRKILRLTDDLSVSGRGAFAERELVIEEATKAYGLLLTNLAVRSIFGRHNSRRIACARALGDFQPAVDWLAPYEG